MCLNQTEPANGFPESLRRLARLQSAAALIAIVTLAGACSRTGPTRRGLAPDTIQARTATPVASANAPPVTQEDPLQTQRRHAMVTDQIAARGITDPAVLEAMRSVPRHEFVPERRRSAAYEDRPLTIGHRQTISQPYIVALMTELAQPAPGKKALDIGTGSGYQLAVLARLVDHVTSIEIVCPLADAARARLARLGVDNVTIHCADGFAGRPDEAPFDVIIVAAAPAEIPPPLIAQLAVGGRLVIPVGEDRQELLLVEKRAGGDVSMTRITPVRFVPMTGRAQER